MISLDLCQFEDFVYECDNIFEHINTFVSTVSVIYVYVLYKDAESVNYMGLAVVWNPGEVWFVVCHHHSCLGTARVPALRYLVYLAKWPCALLYNKKYTKCRKVAETEKRIRL